MADVYLPNQLVSTTDRNKSWSDWLTFMIETVGWKIKAYASGGTYNSSPLNTANPFKLDWSLMNDDLFWFILQAPDAGHEMLFVKCWESISEAFHIRDAKRNISVQIPSGGFFPVDHFVVAISDGPGFSTSTIGFLGGAVPISSSNPPFSKTLLWASSPNWYGGNMPLFYGGSSWPANKYYGFRTDATSSARVASEIDKDKIALPGGYSNDAANYAENPHSIRFYQRPNYVASYSCYKSLRVSYPVHIAPLANRPPILGEDLRMHFYAQDAPPYNWYFLSTSGNWVCSFFGKDHLSGQHANAYSHAWVQFGEVESIHSDNTFLQPLTAHANNRPSVDTRPHLEYTMPLIVSFKTNDLGDVPEGNTPEELIAIRNGSLGNSRGVVNLWPSQLTGGISGFGATTYGPPIADAIDFVYPNGMPSKLNIAPSSPVDYFTRHGYGKKGELDFFNHSIREQDYYAGRSDLFRWINCMNIKTCSALAGENSNKYLAISPSFVVRWNGDTIYGAV